LFPAQAFEGCPPEPAGRPLEPVGDGRSRWMAAHRRFGAGDRIRLTCRLVRPYFDVRKRIRPGDGARGARRPVRCRPGGTALGVALFGWSCFHLERSRSGYDASSVDDGLPRLRRSGQELLRPGASGWRPVEGISQRCHETATFCGGRPNECVWPRLDFRHPAPTVMGGPHPSESTRLSSKRARDCPGSIHDGVWSDGTRSAVEEAP
jgi:hypothetical protein